MTRAELEEAIANLEYLISRQFNPAKVEEYERQLRSFRLELRALELEQCSPTSTLFGSKHVA